MNKSKIEWTDYTVNPVKGLCPAGCSYCYARRLYERFHWDPTVRLDVASIYSIDKIKDPSHIFVGSTMELFGDHIRPEWYDYIWGMVRGRPQHTFIFLTKLPQNLPREWPDNCWVGVTLTHQGQHGEGTSTLMENIKASVKFLSVEPMLGAIKGAIPTWCDWLIIGQQTPVRKSTMPKVEWIEEIVSAADKAGVPLFLKDNLKSLLMPDHLMNDIFWESEKAKLRQEFPSNVGTKATGHNNKQTQEGK